jgi:hypothetical protein
MFLSLSLAGSPENSNFAVVFEETNPLNNIILLL